MDSLGDVQMRYTPYSKIVANLANLQSIMIIIPTSELKYSRTSANSNSPLNRTELSPISLGFHATFLSFYPVNSNSDISNSPLIRTKVPFP